MNDLTFTNTVNTVWNFPPKEKNIYILHCRKIKFAFEKCIWKFSRFSSLHKCMLQCPENNCVINEGVF